MLMKISHVAPLMLSWARSDLAVLGYSAQAAPLVGPVINR
jgi:hypothetical protein